VAFPVSVEVCCERRSKLPETVAWMTFTSLGHIDQLIKEREKWQHQKKRSFPTKMYQDHRGWRWWRPTTRAPSIPIRCSWRIGGVASLGTNKGPGIDTFAAGPAVAAITKKGTKWIFGFLNQNLFSFGGDIKITQIQPIVSYTLNNKISFAIGDAQITIDWNRKKFVAVPLSSQVNYIAMLGKQPIRLFFNPQYNVINIFGQRRWTIGGGFALLLR
jgi:hypothetical protein